MPAVAIDGETCDFATRLRLVRFRTHRRRNRKEFWNRPRPTDTSLLDDPSRVLIVPLMRRRDRDRDATGRHEDQAARTASPEPDATVLTAVPNPASDSRLEGKKSRYRPEHYLLFKKPTE
jgi:hypothetical protein